MLLIDLLCVKQEITHMPVLSTDKSFHRLRNDELLKYIVTY